MHGWQLQGLESKSEGLVELTCGFLLAVGYCHPLDEEPLSIRTSFLRIFKNGSGDTRMRLEAKNAGSFETLQSQGADPKARAIWIDELQQAVLA